MKYYISKEMILSDSHNDDNMEVGAGVAAGSGAAHLSVVRSEEGTVEHCAFSSLIQLLRRSRGLTISQVAERARVDEVELISIECDVRYEPRPRTIHKLAEFYGLAERRLLELSNLTTAQSPDLKQAAVRFAANASNVMELSSDERRALSEFVRFLSSR